MSPSNGKAAKKPKLADSFKRLLDESMSDQMNPELISQLLGEVHLAGGRDRKTRRKKLRNKDRALVNLIQKIRQDRDVLVKTRPELANFFIHLIAALETIEAILWELKGEKGPVPNPGEDMEK